MPSKSRPTKRHTPAQEALVTPKIPRIYLIGMVALALVALGLEAIPSLGGSLALSFWLVMSWLMMYRFISAAATGAGRPVPVTLCVVFINLWTALLVVLPKQVPVSTLSRNVGLALVILVLAAAAFTALGFRKRQKRQ